MTLIRQLTLIDEKMTLIHKNRLFKLTTFTCDSMWYMYIEPTGVPSVVSTDTMKIHGWKQSMCVHQLEYNKQQTDLVLSPSYFGFFNSGVESSSPDPLLWLDSYKWHSDKSKLYTGMQPLVFPCYTHVLHRSSISYIYNHV